MAGDANMYRTPRWRKLRLEVLRRDAYTCVMCGASVRGKGQARVDHIRPVKIHPELAWDKTNLRTLCPTCDNRRHSEKMRKTEAVPIGADGFPVGSEWSSSLSGLDEDENFSH